MKKSIKNIGLILALGLTSAVFFSCDKDDDGGGIGDGNGTKITATNISGISADAKKVGLSVELSARTSLTNNGFALNLPTTLDDKYLELVTEDYEIEGVKISNREAKIYYLEDLDVYDEDDIHLGYLFLEEDRGDDYYCTSWMYADRDVAIKGENIRTVYSTSRVRKYNLILKKGWNVIYERFTESNEENVGRVRTSLQSTSKPEGVNYSWWYQSDN